jgi:hypothetical protein
VHSDGTSTLYLYTIEEKAHASKKCKKKKNIGDYEHREVTAQVTRGPPISNEKHRARKKAEDPDFDPAKIISNPDMGLCFTVSSRCNIMEPSF